MVHTHRERFIINTKEKLKEKWVIRGCDRRRKTSLLHQGEVLGGSGVYLIILYIVAFWQSCSDPVPSSTNSPTDSGWILGMKLSLNDKGQTEASRTL